MLREGRRDEAADALRKVLGEERAAVVAAAFMPDVQAKPGPPERPAKTDIERTSNRQPPKQSELLF